MKAFKILSLIMAGTIFLPSCSPSSGKASEKPNILIILADDMGFSDLGCYGGEMETPNLDQLASEGVRFSQFYNTARCCPTRASLLTGLYPHQAGVGYMTEKLGETTAYQGHLRSDRYTIAELMKQAGYTTLHVGKWHVGNEKTGSDPGARGFDRAWSPWSRVDYWNTEKIYEDGMVRERNENEKKYLTDVTGDKALEYIDYALDKDQPFFMYLAFNSAHWPLHAKPQDIERYRGKYMSGWDKLRLDRIRRLEEIGMVSGTDPKKTENPFVPDWDKIPAGDAYKGYHAMTSQQHDQDDWDSKIAVYAAQIFCMDQNIGRIVDRLREKDELDNTLIIYLQDNGACAEHIGKNDTVYPGGPDSYTAYHLPWAYLSNTPFRMYKHFMHEGGISTPFIVHWPNGIPEKREGLIEKESFGQLIDLLPTCLDAAGLKNPDIDYDLEGESLLGEIRGEEDNSDREVFWEHEGNRCVRKGDWKLISRYEDDVLFFKRWEFPVDRRTREWELYNVKEDRWEQNECADEHPALVEELIGDYENYYCRVGALPRKKVIKGSRYEF